MELICFSLYSVSLVWEKPAHSGTFPSHSTVYKKPWTLPLLVALKGDGSKESKAGCRMARGGSGGC